MRLLFALPLLAGWTWPASASPLSFDRALELAEANAPSLTAREAQLAASQSRALAAGQLPDPRLALNFDNLPISGPPAFTLDGSMMTAQRVGLQQDFPNLAKRHAMEARAGAAIDVAQAQVAVTRRDILVATASAWIDLFYSSKRRDAVEAILQRLGPLTTVARSGVASGAARPAQSLEIQQAIARLEDRKDALSAEVESARAMLARWTNDDSPQASGDAPTLALEPLTLRRLVDRHPQLLAAEAEVLSARADSAAARAEKRPDWGVSFSVGHRDPAYGNVISVGATMTLPIFASKRQNPRIKAADSDVAAALAERDDTRRALAAELERGLAAHAMQVAQWQRAEGTLLPLARQQADLETASYGAGRAGLNDVISAETALAETELDALDREARVARQAATLLLTFGSDDQ